MEMTGAEQREVMGKALDTWGTDQITILFEEMAELQKELCKFLRGNDTTQEIAEELADVKICIAEMEMLFAVEDKVESNINDKLLRLKKRLELI